MTNFKFVPIFQLKRLASGRLQFISAHGEVHHGVTPVRAFPLAAPEKGISLISAEGNELVWIEQLSDMPAAVRFLLREELGVRDFAPEIKRLVSISSFGTPCVWTVQTDRGDTTFILNGEEDIRRVQGNTLLISASDGVQYGIADTRALNKTSRRLLERFL